MYDYVTSHFYELVVNFVMSVLAALCVIFGARQYQAFTTYLTASKNSRRRQNSIEIWRRIKNTEYLIQMEQDSADMRFAVQLLLGVFILFILSLLLPPDLQLGPPAPSLVTLATMLLVLAATFILFLYMVLLSARNKTARMFRAGMHQKKGKWEWRKKLSTDECLTPTKPDIQ